MADPITLPLDSAAINCSKYKEIYIPIICAFIPVIFGAIAYFIKSPIQKKKERREKINEIIESIVADANVYFMSNTKQNGVMINITTKLSKLSSTIGCELRSDQAIIAAYSEFRKIVVNDDEIKSRAPNVIKLVADTIRLKADTLKSSLKIEA